MRKNNKRQTILQILLFLGIVICINFLANQFHTFWDLTEEKRFTLTEPTYRLLEDLDEPVFVRVLLDGEFPAGFKRLQTATMELLDDFRGISPYIEYSFEDPSAGTNDEINAMREELAKDKIIPVNLRVKGTGETKEKLIYPFAICSYKGRERVVNLLESERLGVPSDVVLNNSISLLEYKMANAIQKLISNNKRPIVFTAGNGELEKVQTRDLEKTLRQFYDTGRINLDSTYQLSPEIAVLVVANPRKRFSEKHKFMIDQFVMNGGNVIFLLDRLMVNLDSMRRNGKYVPPENDLNLDDLLFKYGARIQPNLVLDLECTRIPMVTGQLGSGNQYDLFSWYYHPVVKPASDHPIVKSLDRVNLRFPSTIDTIRTRTPVKKNILLASSDYSRVQFTPVQLDFEVLRYDPDPAKFNKGPQNVSVLLEGNFPSLYANRVTDDMKAGLARLKTEFKPSGDPAKVLLVSDGDVIKNLYDPKQKTVQPLGFNPYENYTFANKDFLVNAIEYMIDDRGVINARAKEVKLRMLDKVRAKKEKTQWQVLNIVVPLAFLAVFGLLFNFIRRRRFAG